MPEVQKTDVVITRNAFYFIIMQLFTKHFSPRIWGTDYLKMYVIKPEFKMRLSHAKFQLYLTN